MTKGEVWPLTGCSPRFDISQAMLADLIALLDKPVLLLVVLAIGGVIGIALESALNRIDRERRQAYWRGRNAAKGTNGKAAPFKRNDRMLDAMPVGIIIFPGTGIQDNLADKARKLGIPIWDFRKQRHD